jgi:hypothetical protein
MKKLIPYLILINGLISCNGQTKNKSDDMFLLHKNPISKFSIVYPKDWDTTKKDNRIIFMAVEKRKSETDKFRENFTIYSVELPNGYDLDTVLESAKQGFIQKYPNDNIVEQGVKKNKNGITYGLFKNKISTNGDEIITTVAYFQKSNIFFVLSLSNNKIEDEIYSPIFSRIIDSYKFEE